MLFSFGAPGLEKWLSRGSEILGRNWPQGGVVFASLLCAFYLLPWPETFFASGFWFCAFIIAKSDLAFYLIPDIATLTLAGLGLLRAIVPSFSPHATVLDLVSGLWPHLGSALLAFTLFFAIGWSYEWLTGREGLGFGDVKLAGALGLWLNPEGIALALELAAFAGFILVIRQGFRGEGLRFVRLPLGALLAPSGFFVYFTSCFAGVDFTSVSLS